MITHWSIFWDTLQKFTYLWLYITFKNVLCYWSSNFSIISRNFSGAQFFTGWVKKRLACLTGCGMKSTQPIFKTEILIWQSNANLHVKILFGKITHLLDPVIRKMLIRCLHGPQHSMFDSNAWFTPIDFYSIPLGKHENCQVSVNLYQVKTANTFQDVSLKIRLDYMSQFRFWLNWYRYNYDLFPNACGNGKVPYWFYFKPFRCSTKEFDWAVLESLSLLCTLEHSTKCINLSFDSHSFLECSYGPKSAATFSSQPLGLKCLKNQFSRAAVPSNYVSVLR